MEGNKHIIIDSGSGFVKAGFSSEKEPRAVFRTLVAEKRRDDLYYVGDSAEDKMWDKSYEIEDPRIYCDVDGYKKEGWDLWEKIWYHCFYNKLKCEPKNHKVLLTDPPMNKKKNREKMTEIMFESFEVPGLYVGNTATLSAYGCGKMTGLVCDLGERVSRFVPVFEGSPLTNAIVSQDYGERNLTDKIKKYLFKFYCHREDKRRFEVARAIKEKYSYVAKDYMDYKKELNNIEEKTYTSSEGFPYQFKEIMIEAPEDLFRCVGANGEGSQVCANEAIKKCAIDKRKDLYENIILVGGHSMFKGLPERFKKEMVFLAPDSMKEHVNVIAIPERKYAAFIGGSFTSSQESFDKFWITKEEYQEQGADIVNTKCI